MLLLSNDDQQDVARRCRGQDLLPKRPAGHVSLMRLDRQNATPRRKFHTIKSYFTIIKQEVCYG